MTTPTPQPLTESTFLILLALTTPRHGYAVMQEVATLSMKRVRLGPGTLYGALSTMVSKGLIEPVGETDAGGERRKVYALRPEGRDLLRREIARLRELIQIADQVLAAGDGR